LVSPVTRRRALDESPSSLAFPRVRLPPPPLVADPPSSLAFAFATSTNATRRSRVSARATTLHRHSSLACFCARDDPPPPAPTIGIPAAVARASQGERLRDVIKEQEEVAEGVDTAIALCELIKKSDRSYRLDLKFPIIFGVAAVLREEVHYITFHSITLHLRRRRRAARAGAFPSPAVCPRAFKTRH